MYRRAGAPGSGTPRFRASTSIRALLEAYAVRTSIPGLEATLRELEAQVAAFGDPDSQKQRQHNEQVVKQNRALSARTTALIAAAASLPELVTATVNAVPLGPRHVDENDALTAHHAALDSIIADVRRQVSTVADAAVEALRAAEANQKTGPWAELTQTAETEVIAFQQLLDTLGVDPRGYLELREKRDGTEAALRKASERAEQIPSLERAVDDVWRTTDALYAERISLRQSLLHQVENRAQTLKFHIGAHRNTHSWIRTVRSLLNLKAETYGDDVRALGRWLWEGPEEDLPARLRLWREALTTNDYNPVEDATGCRASWWKKLRNTDEVLRVTLATTMADDTATMYFCRTGADPGDPRAWQQVTNGSAGQRSAAMLAFVLNYGTEPLILDQPEDDLDTALITKLVVPQIRRSRWTRQLIIVTHHANIPVNGDAEQVIVLDNDGFTIRVKTSADPNNTEREIMHAGPIEVGVVRQDIQEVLEGGMEAFRARERRYNNDMNPAHEAQREMQSRPRKER